MKFARLAAALVALAACLSPIRQFLRGLFTTFGPEPSSLDSWVNGLAYLAVLLVGYGALLGVFWLIRFVARRMERWEDSGLHLLDQGVHGAWARRWAVVLSAGALVTAVLAGDVGRIAALAEALAVGMAVIIAVSGAPPPDLPLDAYDPLPAPRLPGPEPAPAPAPVLDADALPLSRSWYFRRDPTNMAAAATHYTVDIQASKSRLEGLRQRDHSVQCKQDYTRFVRDGMTQEVAALSARIRTFSEKDSLDPIAEINNVLAFAQRFAYVKDLQDKGVQEYPKYPLETLVEDRGDCEDHAIIAAACLLNLGYDTCLVDIDYPEGPGHIALAVSGPDDLPGAFFLAEPNSGQRYYYCEATANSSSREPNGITWRMGEMPDKPQARGKLTLLRIV